MLEAVVDIDQQPDLFDPLNDLEIPHCLSQSHKRMLKNTRDLQTICLDSTSLAPRLLVKTPTTAANIFLTSPSISISKRAGAAPDYKSEHHIFHIIFRFFNVHLSITPTKLEISTSEAREWITPPSGEPEGA